MVKPVVRNHAMTSVLIKLHFLLAPILTDFIWNTKRELYDEKLEDALGMLNLEWSKDDYTKTQCNRLSTSPIYRGNASNKNGPARVKRWMQWGASQTAGRWWPYASATTRSACRNRHKLGFRSRHTVTSKREVCQNPSRVSTLGKNKNKSYRGPHYMHGAAQTVDNREQQLEFLTKAMVGPRTRSNHSHPRGN